MLEISVNILPAGAPTVEIALPNGIILNQSLQINDQPDLSRKYLISFLHVGSVISRKVVDLGENGFWVQRPSRPRHEKSLALKNESTV